MVELSPERMNVSDRTDAAQAELKKRDMGPEYNYGWMLSFAARLEHELAVEKSDRRRDVERLVGEMVAAHREAAALREANDKIGRKAALVQALREEICEAEWGSNAAGAAMFFEFIRKWTRHIDATESTARLPCKHVFSAELNDAGDCVMAVTCDKCGIPEDIARSDADELADEAKQSQPGRGCGICDSVPTAQCDKPDCPSLSAGDGQ
jgi:hypothetical protein